MLTSFRATAETRPIVVELFTSQSCSSCPPADALLGELARRKDVIALGFHVTYWDGPSWRDPFSSAEATRRQRDYERLLHRLQVYTPQMIVEGTLEMVGSDRDEVLSTVDREHPQSIAAVAFAPDRRSVEVEAGDGQGEVLLARFIKNRTTPVGGGENARRTLHDTNAVESLTPLGVWKGAKVAFQVAPPQDGEGLAVLVQASDGRMLGAAALQ
jgi:hypothetical protein